MSSSKDWMRREKVKSRKFSIWGRLEVFLASKMPLHCKGQPVLERVGSASIKGFASNYMELGPDLRGATKSCERVQRLVTMCGTGYNDERDCEYPLRLPSGIGPISSCAALACL